MDKRIPIEQLDVGMYLTGVDKSWFSTPFLSHKRRITTTDEIVLLKQHGVREVTIDTDRGKDTPAQLSTAPSVPPAHALVQPDLWEVAAQLRTVWTHVTAAVETLFQHHVGAGDPFDGEDAKRIVNTLQDAVLHCPATFLILAQMQQGDAGLFTHAVDTCALALLIGKEKHLGSADLEHLSTGALLHDVGRMRLPPAFQPEFSHHTEAEHDPVRDHPRIGANLLATSDQIPADVRRIVLEHHERLDGSGYPAGRVGATIFSLSQIVGISDEYLSLVTGRGRAVALAPAPALQELNALGAAGHFDPALVTLVNGLVSTPHSGLTDGLELTHTLARLDGDHVLLGQMITVFLKELPEMLAGIRAALDSKTAGALERSAHSLKGAASNIGAPAAYAAALALQEIGQQENLSGAWDALKDLEQELDRITPALQTVMQHGVESLLPKAPVPAHDSSRQANGTGAAEVDVLLVDGVKSSQVMMYGVLRNFGIKKIQRLEDGREALEALRHGRPDLVIMDWNLPGMSGVELLKAIRTDPQLTDLPVLISTGTVTQAEVLEAKQYRVNGLLLRPFTTQKVEEELRKVIGKRL